VGTYAITGGGTGLRLNITATSGSITATTIASVGNGYSVGDVVGITTSDVSPASGRDARVTITGITGLDTLYVTNAQAESFTTVGVSTLVYYNDTGTAVSLAGTTIRTSLSVGGIYAGNFMKVNHFDHGMYATNNKLTLYNVEPTVPPTTLTLPLLSTDTSISIASTTNFTMFEGISVSASNPGYIKIENEIIKYTSIGTGQLLSITRGIDGTLVLDYPVDTKVYDYEFNGVSLRRINKTHDITDTGIDIDSYYVEFDRTNFDSNVVNRNTDGSLTSAPQLSFNSETSAGGANVNATENIQYDTIIPEILSLVPGPQQK